MYHHRPGPSLRAKTRVELGLSALLPFRHARCHEREQPIDRFPRRFGSDLAARSVDEVCNEAKPGRVPKWHNMRSLNLQAHYPRIDIWRWRPADCGCGRALLTGDETDKTRRRGGERNRTAFHDYHGWSPALPGLPHSLKRIRCRNRTSLTDAVLVWMYAVALLVVVQCGWWIPRGARRRLGAPERRRGRLPV